MADRYWIANLEANQLWTTATNWADNADGSGSNVVPVANDNVHFGHATTLAAGKGFGLCELAGATATLAKFTSYQGYNKVATTNNFTIDGSGEFIPNPTTGFSLEQLGFRVGMVITVTGAANAGNNSTFEISSLGSNKITVTSATGMVTEGTPVALTITYDPFLDLKGQALNMTSPSGGTLMTMDSKIKNTTGTGAINFLGAYVSGAGNRYFLCGGNQTFDNRDTIVMTFTSTDTMYFDDGIYPIVQIQGGKYTCDYSTPTSTKHRAVKLYKFKETAIPLWNLVGGTQRNNIKKIFEVESTTSFVLLNTNFNTGKSTWSFFTDNNFTIPTSGDYINYPTGFTVRWYNLIIKGGSPSNKGLVPARRNLQVNSLTIETGGQVIGELSQSGSGTKYKGSSTITSNTRPTIKGSWNFSQVADGVYASLLTESYSITPSHGDRGALQFSYGGGAFHSQSKINLMMDSFATDWDAVAWLQACDGAYFKSSFYAFCQTYAPATGAGDNTIWISNGSPSVPYFTDSAGTKHSLLGGGGGGGMTSFDVAGTSGSAQTITNGNTLTIAAGTGITTTASATDTVTIASTITQYTDPMAIAAVEGEATLALTGQVTMVNGQDITWASGSNIGTNAAATDLTLYAADDLFLTAVDVVALKTGSTYGLWMTNAQDIGVGTQTPAARLDVRGADDDSVSGMFSGSLSVENSIAGVPSTRAYAFLSVNDQESMIGGNLRFDDSVTGGTHAGYASGTNVRGGSGIVFTNSNPSGDGSIIFLRQNDSNDDTWTVKESGRFNASGNLGIGNNNPAQKLDVTGTIRQSNATDKVIYADANGDLGALTLGTNLSLSGSTLNAAGGGGGGGVTVQDEGVTLATTATTLNFVGAGVVASGTGATKTITIAGGGGAAGEVVEFVNSNTTINMNTTIAVCASNTDCTAKAGVTGAPWAGMTDFGGEFENYDFTATSGVFGAAQKGLVNVPVPTVGRKLTLVVPLNCNGRTLPQGISQISCTGQANAFIGHDLAGMVNGSDAGKATQGSNVLLPESYLFGIWNDARRSFNTNAYLGHHAITLVGVPAPTGSAAELVINANGTEMGDVMPTALWWVETNNEFLYDSVDREAPTGFFNHRGFGATAWGQLYVVC